MGRRMKDITGLKFGKLTALNPTSKRSGNNIIWECVCDCGNKVEVSGKHLRTGNTKSCGCNRGPLQKDLSNQIFGKLTALYQNKERKSGKTTWHCQCKCGSETDVISSNLISGHTISCGCSKSKGEEKIARLLKENNIDYKREFIFKDLKGINGGSLRFDFAILDENFNLLSLIEYDGKQHYSNNTRWGESEILKQNDEIKNNYCLNNKIPLTRISYLQNFVLQDLL